MSTRIIAMLNHKGGVGKTTSTLNLGKALALKKQKVLIVDIDPQSNLSQSVGIEDPKKAINDALVDKAKIPIQKIEKNFDIVPASLDLSGAEIKLISELNGYFRLREALEPVAKNYNYILIDCPPSLGILTINAMIAADEVIIVVQSQYLAIKGLNTILELMDELRKNLNPKLIIGGMLLTQVNRTVVSKTIVEAVQNEHQERVFKTVIRQNVKITEASTLKQDIFTYDSSSPAAEDYMRLAEELMKNE